MHILCVSVWSEGQRLDNHPNIKAGDTSAGDFSPKAEWAELTRLSAHPLHSFEYTPTIITLHQLFHLSALRSMAANFSPCRTLYTITVMKTDYFQLEMIKFIALINKSPKQGPIFTRWLNERTLGCFYYLQGH